MKQLNSILSLTVLAFLSLSAHAAEISGPWDVTSVDIQQVHEQVQPVAIEFDNNCNSNNEPMNLTDIGWSEIINIGQRIWTIVEAGKPVVNVHGAPVAFALPRGITCWNELDSWQAPKIQSYDVTYKNGFGMEVVKFRFRLQYTYGGGRTGKGKYLANVTVMPAQIDVMWGYTFDANVEVEQAVNLGTASNPVAGLELNLKWGVKTVLKQSDNSFHFFVQGDGVSQAVN